MDTVEQKVQEMLRKNKSIIFQNGELITKYYLDALFEEINESLGEVGRISIASLSQKYDLPTKMVMTVLEQRQDKLAGVLRDDYIYTQAFVEAHRGRLRGACLGLLFPTPLTQLVSTHGFWDGLILEQLQALLKEGSLQGRLTNNGEHALFTPALFSKSQRKAVVASYEENGYVEYTRLSELQLGDHQAYLRECCPGGLPLASLYLHERETDALREALVEKARESSWLHATELLPAPLTRADVCQVLQLLVAEVNRARPHVAAADLAALAGAELLVVETCAVARAFVVSCGRTAEPLVAALARERALSLAARLSVTITFAGSGEMPAKSAAQRGKKGLSSSAQSPPMSDGEADSGPEDNPNKAAAETRQVKGRGSKPRKKPSRVGGNVDGRGTEAKSLLSEMTEPVPDTVAPLRAADARDALLRGPLRALPRVCVTVVVDACLPALASLFASTAARELARELALRADLPAPTHLPAGAAVGAESALCTGDRTEAGAGAEPTLENSVVCEPWQPEPSLHRQLREMAAQALAGVCAHARLFQLAIVQGVPDEALAATLHAHLLATLGAQLQALLLRLYCVHACLRIRAADSPAPVSADHVTELAAFQSTLSEPLSPPERRCIYTALTQACPADADHGARLASLEVLLKPGPAQTPTRSKALSSKSNERASTAPVGRGGKPAGPKGGSAADKSALKRSGAKGGKESEPASAAAEVTRPSPSDMFFDSLGALAHTHRVKLSAPDKKMCKTMAFQMRCALQDGLRGETDAWAVLQSTVVILHAKVSPRLKYSHRLIMIIISLI